ncbi:hypothetical protein QN277_023412 [Acacia crassicarpa]|uniref:Uncharacterized protein n=1 Tax=Acacia crassicarpa TaxID=499986 RepID=A0AAE1JGW4_9FABA|nr:hypothetical protein QN277_023412 [Acacia crassicarpa]
MGCSFSAQDKAKRDETKAQAAHRKTKAAQPWYRRRPRHANRIGGADDGGMILMMGDAALVEVNCGGGCDGGGGCGCKSDSFYIQGDIYRSHSTFYSSLRKAMGCCFSGNYKAKKHKTKAQDAHKTKKQAQPRARRRRQLRHGYKTGGGDGHRIFLMGAAASVMYAGAGSCSGSGGSGFGGGCGA